MQMISAFFICLVFLFAPTFASAYVGPGLGAGTIGVVLGIIGSIIIALFAIIWYPLKRIIRKLRNPGEQKDKENT